MKLIIQIPCYNEEKYLQTTVNALPKFIDGIDVIEILVIDDGSEDKTFDVAKACGVNHVFSISHRGLAGAFKFGLNKAIELGADIIVNTDADNQYCAFDIEKLVKPILDCKADFVIGARPIENNNDFSLLKKILQKVGSALMRLVSSTDVQDAPSGFRAFSRQAAMQLNVFDNYSYTMETIIQAKAKGLKILSVPVSVNPKTRSSRLVKNIFSYIKNSTFTMIRMFIVYRPFRFFATIALIFLSIGFLIGLRFLYFYITASGLGHVQSLILASILIITGVQIVIIAILADLLSINRKLLEDIQVRVKKMEIKQ